MTKALFSEFVSSYEKSTPIGWIGVAYVYLGSLHLDLREYNDAVNCFHKIIQIFENGSYLPSSIKFFQSCLIKAKVLRHDQDIELSELFACYENYKLTFCKGWTARNIGDVLMLIDDNHLADAKVWFQRAIEEDSRNGMRWQLAQDHACYADWFKKKGDIQGARNNSPRPSTFPGMRG